VPLQGADAVVYLAARVHVMRDDQRDPLTAYRAINTHAAVRAAEGAARAGAKRFVYLSSIKVNGESTFPGRPFDEQSVPAPADPYGVSKLEAETGLMTVAAETGMSVVALRPPMVYGPGARGNFPRLARLARVASRVPLPIASVRNRRSLLYVEHLADAIARIATTSAQLNNMYMVADPEPVSTAELLAVVGEAVGIRPHFFPFPEGALRLAARTTGLRDIADRLLGSLEIDASALRAAVGWSSPTPLREAVRRSFACAPQ
jgi:nucleoside-diphosphate-sugar epimerase